MKRLYDKNELTFALIWIGIFVVLLSIGDNLSAAIGIEKILTMPLSIVVTVVLHRWISKHNLKEKYGLCPFSANLKTYLFFIPLVLLMSVNLWWGIAANFTYLETIFYIVSMLCVGYIEEVIFRGFLFKAIAGNNVKQAIIISSITFGMGHIVNLLNGSPLFDTLLQIFYAAAVGFVFTIIFYKSNSLWPCIITHSVVNALSAFMNEAKVTAMDNVVASIFMCVVSIAYAVYILKASRSSDGETQ